MSLPCTETGLETPTCSMILHDFTVKNVAMHGEQIHIPLYPIQSENYILTVYVLYMYMIILYIYVCMYYIHNMYTEFA